MSGTEALTHEGAGQGHARGWPLAAAITSLLVALLLALFWPTARSMVDTWVRNETFAHGFLILPISLWLAWHRRTELALLTPRASWLGLAGFVLAAILWLAGEVAGVLVVAQFGLVAMIIAAVWSALGDAALRQLVFPLGFLFFAVPMGEALVPPLMDFTADFTVALLRLSGIPVYREGLYFSIPSGNWSVVEACSGVRYLIASVTLGVLYAYLAYQSLRKRLLFIVASALVPILANGLRAYMIVMIGHLSDMRLATGVDHLIYGWVFFGFVMLVLFSVGARWRDPDPTPTPAGSESAVAFRRSRIAAAALLVVLASAGVRAAAVKIESHASPVVAPTTLPLVVGDWTQSARRPWTWQPVSLPAELGLGVAFRRGDTSVTLDVSHYVDQHQDAEAISSKNRIVAKDSPWRIVGRGTHRVATPAGEIAVETYRVDGPQSLAVWRWYRIGSQYTANAYLAKLYQSLYRLGLGRTDGAIVTVAAPVDARHRPPDALMQEFVAQVLPSLSEALDASVGER
ncbi:MAG: exosortase A [Gammaproteobacteria bacterium]|jgi:exosortase A|nr:exosortase A [Gammaproteobacteria bacterium]